MKTDLMNILACPICKNPDLELIIFEQKDQEVLNGLIFCNKCSRYYPIRNTIPIMLPDDLRKSDEDLKFLEKHKTKIPSNILKNGKPFPLYKE
jgi:uncharacterized protein YbaR (Trm112 family)